MKSVAASLTSTDNTAVDMSGTGKIVGLIVELAHKKYFFAHKISGKFKKLISFKDAHKYIYVPKSCVVVVVDDETVNNTSQPLSKKEELCDRDCDFISSTL